MSTHATPPPVNAMTVDVEEYFQVSAFESHIPRADWDRFPSRVEASLDRLLELFARHGVTATFFTLGWIAERHPGMVRRILEQGHELASHGWSHVRVTQQDRTAFRADVTRTRHLLEDLAGRPVWGYRAASYSIGASNLWALEELQAAGYRYSSSIFPIRHDLYGMPEAPRFPFFPQGPGGLLEVPMTTLRLFGRNLPCAGGGWFRLLPYAGFRWALRRVNRREGQAGVFYCHPWEFDPDQPRLSSLGLKTRVRHYLNLTRTEARLERLLKDFRWGSMAQVFLEPALGMGGACR